MFIYSPIKGPQGAYRFLKKVLWLYQILMNENRMPSLILNDQNFFFENSFYCTNVINYLMTENP